MKKLVVILIALLGLCFTQPAEARGPHDHISLSLGFGFGAWPFYDPYWPAPAYYAPPPVYYAPAPVYYLPQPARTVYVEPARPVYRPVETVYVPAAPINGAMPATQTSPTYTDGQGRSCRHFETLVNGDIVYGTACLHSDGTWRTVE